MGVWEDSSRSELMTQGFAKDSSSLVEVAAAAAGNRNTAAARMEMMASSSWIRGDLIGAGAFGKVNLALNRENGELFAVKSIECNERNTSEMLAMKNEVQILSSLDSPYVVKCLGSSFSVENGKSMHNVFVEYMSGGSLADLMKKFGGHFDEPLIRNYTRSILEGIYYLHKQEIVHCDIKGKNVLVGSSGVKLADFGAAKRVGQANSVLDSAQEGMKGTPLWMAPEVINFSEQGPSSDIWSLGCTVLEMATGKAPWIHIANGATNPFIALYHIHMKQETPELPSNLSEQGHDFLRKCFVRNPRVRSTAEELLQHPFTTESFSVQEERNSKPEPSQSSPTSVLDFPSHYHNDVTGYTSSIVNSVPILRYPLFAKRAPVVATPVVNFQSEEDSNKQSSSASGAADWWCNSPLSPMPGQWIVVRSPKASASTSCEVPKVVVAEAAAEVVAAVVTECELFPAAQEEVAVGPELSTSATDENVSIEVLILAEKQYDVDEEAYFSVASDMVCDMDVMVKECVASTISDMEVVDNVASRLLANAHSNNSSCSSSVGVEGCQSGSSSGECSSSRHHTSSRLSASSSNIGRMSRNILHYVLNFGRRFGATNRTGSQSSCKFASLRASLGKLATAHRKMTPRGRRGKSLLLRFTIRKEVHELVYQRLSLLGRSLHSYSFRLIVNPTAIAYLEKLGFLQPQIFRHRFLSNKSATPWWLPYKIPVFHVLILLGFFFYFPLLSLFPLGSFRVLCL